MMGLITPSLELEALADCDLIIEADYENMDVKKEIFGKLDQVAKTGAILASNTSYLDVNEIAASTTIGRAHDCTPVTTEHIVTRLLPEKKKITPTPQSHKSTS